MNDTTPHLVEESEGGYLTHWYCEVPGMGIKFKVLRDHWLDTEPPIREIHEIELVKP